MANDAHKADAVPARECCLEEGWDAVRFVVDGVDRQTVPFDAYAALYAKLGASIELNRVPVETGGGVVHFRLSPLEEVRKGRVVLATEDGVTYGRSYRMTALQGTGDGVSAAVIADAAGGEVVDRVPWPEMVKRARSGACRGASVYSHMLGDFSGRLYFEATGEIYAPPRKGKKEEEAEEAPAADEPGPLAALRLWVRARPKLAYAIAAAGAVIVLASFYFSFHEPLRRPDAVDFANLHSVDTYIETHALISGCLRGVDLGEYARSHPDALKESIHRLEVFLLRIQRAKLNAKQSARVETIRYELQQLQAASK
jgi:hypothetical protein